MKNLEVIKNPSSHISEMYRSIRANIVFCKKHEDIKSIVFTSYQDKEGKSTVVCNLSVTFSDIGKKVLIVDTNYRNPYISNVFGVDNKNGLYDILKNNENINNCIKPTKLDNLFVLSCGSSSEKFSDIISADSMKILIDELESKFDYIFIDTSSIGEYSDGCVLASYSDGCIVVASCGEVDINKVKICKEKLSSIGANILGAVVNKFEE